MGATYKVEEVGIFRLKLESVKELSAGMLWGILSPALKR